MGWQPQARRLQHRGAAPGRCRSPRAATEPRLLRGGRRKPGEGGEKTGSGPGRGSGALPLETAAAEQRSGAQRGARSLLPGGPPSPPPEPRPPPGPPGLPAAWRGAAAPCRAPRARPRPPPASGGAPAPAPVPVAVTPSRVPGRCPPPVRGRLRGRLPSVLPVRSSLRSGPFLPAQSRRQLPAPALPAAPRRAATAPRPGRGRRAQLGRGRGAEPHVWNTSGMQLHLPGQKTSPQGDL